MFCFVSTLVKLATNDNVVKLVTAHCCLANVQLFCSAAVSIAKQKNVDVLVYLYQPRNASIFFQGQIYFERF